MALGGCGATVASSIFGFAGRNSRDATSQVHGSACSAIKDSTVCIAPDRVKEGNAIHTARSRVRRAFNRYDALACVAVVALLALALPNVLTYARAQARGATCAANLSGIMTSFYIYANDNLEWFPHHYYQPHYRPGPIPGSFTHDVRWVGTMGSRGDLSISQATSPDVSPQASHPSRSLFLLIVAGLRSPADFVCPESSDEIDDLVNYDDDAGGQGQQAPGLPGVSRFD